MKNITGANSARYWRDKHGRMIRSISREYKVTINEVALKLADAREHFWGTDRQLMRRIYPHKK